MAIGAHRRLSKAWYPQLQNGYSTACLSLQSLSAKTFAVESGWLSLQRRSFNRAGYVFLLSPNQTPFRDQLYIKKLIGLGPAQVQHWLDRLVKPVLTPQECRFYLCC